MRAKRLIPWLVLLGVAALTYARAPQLVLHPRIWAEEGTVYLAYACSEPWLRVLLAPHQGYYALWPNLATLLGAQVVGLRYAAHVTTYCAFLVQLIPPALLLWSRSSLWGQPGTWRGLALRVLGVAAIQFTPSSGEAWLNTINSQFYWSLIAFLILAEDTAMAEDTATAEDTAAAEDTRYPSRLRRWIYRVLLVLAGLTGPVTAFLAPAFVLHALRARRGEALIQAGLLILCACTQVWAALGASASGLSLAERWGHLDVPGLATIVFNRTVVAPLLGFGPAGELAQALVTLRQQHPGSFSTLGYGLAALQLGGLLALAWREPALRGPLAVGYLLVVVLSVATALVGAEADKFDLVHPGGAIRYFYGPSAMLLLLMVSNISLQAPAGYAARSLLCAALVLLSVTLGAWHYRELIEPFVSDNWPWWQAEVQRWELNPQRELLIWPQGWKMRLTR